MDFISLAREHLNFTLSTFENSTTQSSLNHCRKEIEEIEANLNSNIRDAEEYADAIMCLIDAAKRDNIDVSEIIVAFAKKVEKNKNRSWSQNEDGSYSHVR